MKREVHQSPLPRRRGAEGISVSARRAAIALMLAGTGVATAVRAEEESGTFELGAIEVVGEDLTTTYNPTVETVTAEEIRRFNRTDTASAASLLPGVTIQNVGARSEKLLFVRGFNSRQVPLYIDGIPVYVPYDGNIDLSRMTTADLSKIEVSKGYSSVLFGPNALGGSINLVTLKPQEKLTGDASFGVDIDDSFDFSTYRTSANVGSDQGLWYVQLGGSWLNRDFFRLSESYQPNGVENGGRRNNSGSEDYKLSLKLGLTPNATDEYAISYYNQQASKETPPYAGMDPSVNPRFWQWPEYDKQSIYFLSRTIFAEKNYLKLRAYYDTFDNTLNAFDDATYTTQERPFAFTSAYDDYTIGGGLEVGTAMLERNTLRLAFSYKKDVHRETDNPGDPKEHYEDDIYSLALEDTVRATDKLSLVVGSSYDVQNGLQAENNVDGVLIPFETDLSSALNLQGGAFYQINDSTRLHLTGARRTRFPTIKDRYSFRLGSALPNPGLQPETATHFELGLAGRAMVVEYSVNVFTSVVSDAIENVTISPSLCSRPPCFQLQNISKQRNRGFEVSLDSSPLPRLEAHIDYTYLERENVSSPELEVIDTPDHKVFAYLGYDLTDAWRVLYDVSFESSRFSSTDGTRETSSFVVMGVRTSYQTASGLEAEMGLLNITDRNYAYDEGFFEPGRTLFVNVRYRF